MFVNMETTVLQAMINADADRMWNPVATKFLSAYERNVAVGKIASAIQWHIYDQERPADSLLADLYMHALKRVDFYTIALELVQAAEVCGVSPACGSEGL